MYTMVCDVMMHRRKRFIHIVDEVGEVVWSGQRTFEAFQWMLDREQYTFQMQGEDGRMRVMIGKPKA